MMRSGSGMPRANTSRPRRLRVISCAAASRMASRRLQAEGKKLGELFAGRLAVLVLLGGQQQLRLEKGEPRRHDEIVGGDLEAQAARLVDEVEILLGERQDRDPGEIDLLAAGKREQEIERSLEALDVDHESLAGARRLAVVLLPVGDVIALFRRVVVGVFSRVHAFPAAIPTHATLADSWSRPRHEAKRLIGIEGLRLAKFGDARAANRSALIAVKRRHDPGDLAHLVEVAATVERNIAAGGDHRSGPLRHRPAKGLHADIVAHHQAVSPISSRMTSPIITGETLAGRTASKAGKRTWAVMASGVSAERHEGPEIDRDQLLGRGVDPRQREVAVGPRPAVTRHMLDDRQHAAGKRALDHGAAERRSRFGVDAEGAVADDVVRAGLRHVEHRRAVDGNAERCEAQRQSAARRQRRRPARLPDRAHRDPVDPRRRHLRAIAAGGGAAPVRLPGRSGRVPRRFPPRRGSRRRACGAGGWTRNCGAKRISPQGRVSAKKARSSSLRDVPAQPEMKALKFTTPG